MTADWDDWDDGCTVVEEPRAGGLGTNGILRSTLSALVPTPANTWPFRPATPELQDSLASAARQRGGRNPQPLCKPGALAGGSSPG